MAVPAFGTGRHVDSVEQIARQTLTSRLGPSASDAVPFAKPIVHQQKQVVHVTFDRVGEANAYDPGQRDVRSRQRTWTRALERAWSGRDRRRNPLEEGPLLSPLIASMAPRTLGHPVHSLPDLQPNRIMSCRHRHHSSPTPGNTPCNRAVLTTAPTTSSRSDVATATPAAAAYRPGIQAVPT